MILHGGIFVASFPVIFRIISWADEQGYSRHQFGDQWKMQRAVFGLLPVWQRMTLGLVMLYALVNFGIGLITVTGDPENDLLMTRMFSGHWIFFYAFSALFAWRFLKLANAPASIDT